MTSVTIVGGLLILVLTFHLLSYYDATQSNYLCGADVTDVPNRLIIKG